ncbi:MAG: helix-turn-helix transcriptional regulator [Nitrospinae bacterium]|nr:helix-turn-helix transcriptional regulator [Nitrospinota bacterium]
MKIQPKTLQKLRKERGLSQQELADEARIDKKTVAHIEGGKGEPRVSTVERIAKVLRVKAEILAEAPDTEAVKRAELQKLGLRVEKLLLDGETILAYDLVKNRYGVDMNSLVYAAPLLFTLLAEMSLAERRRRLEKMKMEWETYEQNVPKYMVPHWSRHDDCVEGEENSIDKRDVFARDVFHECLAADESYFDESNSPFNDFLIEQAKNLGPENDAVNHEKIHFYPYGGSLELEVERDVFHEAPLFKGFQERITGGSTRAGYALSRGYTRLRDIPHRLQPPSPYLEQGEEDESAVSERVKWLEDKVPNEDWDKWERWVDSLDINIESPGEGDIQNA